MGNFWRFPFVAFDHGGGSFLIPYLVVTLFIGFPFLVFEFSIGRRYGGSIVHAIDTRLQKRSWLGWAIGLNCFVIVCYYAVIEANLLPIEEKSGLIRKKISGLLCVVGLFLGLLFTTGAGIYWLDIVDHMVAYYGILIAVVIESLLLGFKSEIFKPEVQKSNLMHNVVKTWQFVIRFVIPLAITSIIMTSLWNDIQNPYGDYPRLALLCGGLVVAASIGLGSFFLSRLYTRKAGKTVGPE